MQKEWGAERGLRGTWDHAETLSRAELGPRLSSLSPAPGPALPPAGTLGAERRRTTGIPSLFPKLRAPSGGLWLAQLGSGPQPRTVGGGHVGGVCKIGQPQGRLVVMAERRRISQEKVDVILSRTESPCPAQPWSGNRPAFLGRGSDARREG